VSHAAAIGEHVRIAGYALAGVTIHAADGDARVHAAWDRLDDDVACVILTPSSLAVLAPRLGERPRVVWAVLPR
jgi:hypothetical protein